MFVEVTGEKLVRGAFLPTSYPEQSKKKIKKYDYDAEDTPFISNQKELFNEIVDERREKITDFDKKVNSDDLINRYKGNTANVKFDKFDNALNIINKIQNRSS